MEISKKITEHLKNAFGLESGEALEFYAAYAASLDEALERIEGEASRKNAEAVAKTAHMIKGGALNCAHSELAETAKLTEAAAKARDWDAVRVLIAKMQSLAPD